MHAELRRNNMSPTGKKLIIISLDACITEDMDIMKELPVFSHMMEKGAVVKKIHEIYPSYTYPSHTTMLTGKYPDKHGVTSNFQYTPGVVNPPWNWYHTIVKGKDLMDLSKEAGMSTASVSWPVTGRHPSVDYLVDEIWPINPDCTTDDLTSVFLGSGTEQWLFESAVAPYADLRVRRQQPDTSWFTTFVASDIIREYAPDVVAIHLTCVDTFRHDEGVYSEKAKEGVKLLDEMVRKIVEAVSYTGFLPVTDFAIVSDHGQIDVDRAVNPNVIFAEEGLIELDEKGNITDHKAWCHSVGTSAHVDLKDPGDLVTYGKVQAILKKLEADPESGISKVYTRDEAEKADHLSGPMSFVLETDGHTKFGNAWTGSYAVKKTGGSHGHHPSKGPNPFFIGYGPSFKEGVVIEEARLVDEAPTYAKILGIDMPGADGTPIKEILK